MFAKTVTIGNTSAGNNTFLMRFPPAIKTPDYSINDEENQVHGRIPQNMNNANGSTDAGRIPGSTVLNTNE